MHILNLVVRIIVILVGIAVLFRLPPFSISGIDSIMQEVFGVVVILYGCYRLMSYLSARRNAHEE